MSGGILDHRAIYPFKVFGLEGDFWGVNIDILIATWIAMGIIFSMVILAHIYMKRENSIIGAAFENLVTIFMGLCKDSFSHFEYSYFAFITTIFFFTFVSCIVGILPFVEEATKDINTTFAIALTSFLYVQYQKIRVHGVGGFLKEFVQPFFLLAPIHIVGELSKIVSMSFRLFGNILGGGVILGMILDGISSNKKYYFWMLGITITLLLLAKVFSFSTRLKFFGSIGNFLLNVLFVLAWVQVFLGIFEGLIQSFVVTMLTLTYLAIGTQEEEDGHAHGEKHDDHEHAIKDEHQLEESDASTSIHSERTI